MITKHPNLLQAMSKFKITFVAMLCLNSYIHNPTFSKAYSYHVFPWSFSPRIWDKEIGTKGEKKGWNYYKQNVFH